MSFTTERKVCWHWQVNLTWTNCLNALNQHQLLWVENRYSNLEVWDIYHCPYCTLNCIDWVWTQGVNLIHQSIFPIEFTLAKIFHVHVKFLSIPNVFWLTQSCSFSGMCIFFSHLLVLLCYLYNIYRDVKCKCSKKNKNKKTIQKYKAKSFYKGCFLIFQKTDYHVNKQKKSNIFF